MFSIGYALSILIMAVGKYGVRNFQVTDLDEKYSFDAYLNSRIITTMIAIVVLVVYLMLQMINGYSLNKMISVFLICLWRMVDVIEDVFYGMYQQHGRLDIGAKWYAIRLTVSTVLFCVLVVAPLTFEFVEFIVLLVSLIFAYIFISCSFGKFYIAKASAGENQKRKAGKLLLECFPLFIGTTLSIFVGNIPKYLIDIFQDDVAQACFGYLMMPTFVIMALSQFIYQPQVHEFGEYIAIGDIDRFRECSLRQTGTIVALTFIIILIGYFIGIPALNILYHVELSDYLPELMVLFVGGGFYALSLFYLMLLTVQRKKKEIAVIYVVGSIIGIAVGVFLVLHRGIMGAAILYLIVNTMLSLLMGICLAKDIGIKNFLHRG